MNQTEKKALLLQLIAEKAATADGFLVADAMPMGMEKSASRACGQAVEAGTLHKVRKAKSYVYFATLALANAYQRKHQADILANTPSLITLAPKPVEVVKLTPAATPFYPAHVRVQVFATPVPRNQVVPMPFFVHGGMGAMR